MMNNKSYFQQRINDELGITDELNCITLYNKYDGIRKPYTAKIFSEDEKGNIRILVYTLDRDTIVYDNENATPEKPNINNNRDRVFYVTRLKEPQLTKEGKERKYNIPKGVGTYPFITPVILDKYEKKEKINTLILTEGYFKAFKGYMHGLDIIGLSSITHYKNKKTQELHTDILRVIKECDVENLVILDDGDCLDISVNALEKAEDLYIRPYGFFSAARSIQELLKDYEIEVYFSHIKSDAVECKPKGLDDLLIAKINYEQEVVDDLLLFSKPGYYFYKENITYSTKKLQRYFHINSPDDFYSFHQDKIQEREFIFNGTRFKWDSENDVLKIIIPAAAKNYFRVGDQYHEHVEIPNKYNQLEPTYHKRKKSTIIDDYGIYFLKHIPKYKAFCNVPDHINYQKVMKNCYNNYFPFDHVPREGETCVRTLKFIEHIFEEHQKLGLDYLQLLYQQPTQMLPILCLVSEENNTGKTTFAKWLKAVFTNNMTIVGNAELQDNFNTSYATRLIICCDEAFIDKKVVIEKIKSLATADRIILNAKGRDHLECDFFGKFILLSNNEDNFIYASEHDIRYWIRKVKVPDTDNVNLLSEMIDEIPAFLDYLNKRKMTTQKESRMWFRPELIVTDALKRVIANSKPGIEKELRSKIRTMFFDFGDDMILMSVSVIRKEFFNNRIDENYLEKIIRELMKIDNLKDEEGNYIIKRYTYPKHEMIYGNGNSNVIYGRVNAKHRGKPFVFYKKDFLTEEEIRKTKIQDDEIELSEEKYHEN